ncbi:HlyD family type I secretion periplasmic adaptor subunit [Falsihalocynthiibacter sp. BN13B15]|uniref:HlyD family type I secretion periplasmic adaptor subunit n=1 Tax=Falsihalocynthiibacter sp. BN13B15 TaxID=3240871 RepID=UPI003510935E
MSAQMAMKYGAKRYVALGFVTILILVIGFGYWGATTSISGAIIAQGQIEVDNSRQVVQHLDGGVVQSILVDEGDVVAANQPLIILDPARTLSELSITQSQLYEVSARRARLQAERDKASEIKFDDSLLTIAKVRPEVQDVLSGQSRLFIARAETQTSEVEQLGKQREQIANQLEGIQAQQAALVTQLELIVQELDAQQTLQDRGLATASRVLALLREQARLRGLVGELTSSAAQSQGRMAGIDLAILKIRTDRREETISLLRDLQLRELELRENESSLKERLSNLDIRAPVSGVVLSLQVFAERAVIRPADPLLYIVPQDRPLVISARINPIHVDQVYVGQETVLRFSALDTRDTPELLGTMTHLSPDALVDQQTGLAYYVSEVVLNPGEQEKLPKGSRLIPGMPVETYFRIGDRSPLTFLVKPFADYFNKAFREE